MLFNSPVFIYLFLPFVYFGFYFLARFSDGQTKQKLFLVIASFFFYGWWNISYVPFLVASILINYVIGDRIAGNKASKTPLFIVGVVLNLLFLGYFKYFNFFIDNLNFIFKGDIVVERIVLPLAISFYTFQQIGYLLDAYKGKVQRRNLLDFSFFVAFFPQLIAGPIVIYREMIPQLTRSTFGKFRNVNLIVGLTIFSIGLFKKVVIADNLADFATPVFSLAEHGGQIGFTAAWQAALCYTFQLYFDFSGYSDMAIGLARVFGVKLPLNFFSPFRSTSIIDFWRRWHATLGRFIATDLFLPLSAKFTRKAIKRRLAGVPLFMAASAVPTVITFALVGLWHGAGWTFIVFGFMHGAYMVINYAWRNLQSAKKIRPLPLPLNWGLTFFCIVTSFVIFRADSLGSGIVVLKAMFVPDAAAALHGLSEFVSGLTNVSHWLLFHLYGFEQYFALAVILVFAMPNTMEFMARYNPCIDVNGLKLRSAKSRAQWRATTGWILFSAAVALVGLLNISGTTEFLYFQF